MAPSAVGYRVEVRFLRTEIERFHYDPPVVGSDCREVGGLSFLRQQNDFYDFGLKHILGVESGRFEGRLDLG